MPHSTHSAQQISLPLLSKVNGKEHDNVDAFNILSRKLCYYVKLQKWTNQNIFLSDILQDKLKRSMKCFLKQISIV